MKKRLLEKANQRPMRKYGEQVTVVGESMRKLIKLVVTRFVRIAMCVGRATLKWNLKALSAQDCPCQDLCGSGTVCCD